MISVIIPVYNSEITLAPLLNRLQSVLKGHSLEIILVNDGSRDQSEQVGKDLAEKYDNVCLISLRKNFGEFNAVLCGLNFAQGDYVVIIDDDFQNPPEEILKLVQAAKMGGYDVVYSYYITKHHHWFRNLGSRLTNAMTTYLLQKPKDLYLSSFKLIRKEVVEEIIHYKGPYPYIDGLIFRVTRNIGAVEVSHHQRQEGRSNYTIRKLFSLFITILVGYSSLPLRLFTAIGASLFGGGLLTGLSLLIWSLITNSTVSGWQIVLCILLILNGFLSLFLGIVSEYIGKLFLTQSGLPPYVIRNIVHSKK